MNGTAGFGLFRYGHKLDLLSGSAQQEPAEPSGSLLLRAGWVLGQLSGQDLRGYRDGGTESLSF